MFGVKNESVLETYVKGDMKNITKHDSEWELVGVVFLDLPENGETPKTLKYKIRDNNEWSTGELYPKTDEGGPARGSNIYILIISLFIQWFFSDRVKYCINEHI